jgi:uncharacterized protein (DUF697 family)
VAPRALEIWRLIGEADFEGIRRDAERPFHVLVAAPDEEDARALAARITGEPHPWVQACGPDTARHQAAAGTVDLAILLAHGADLDAELQTVRELLRGPRTPIVTVVLGGGRVGLVPREGEASRVGGDALGEALLAQLAPALLRAAPIGLRVALARNLPPLRAPLVDELIAETAKANAAYALTTAVAESVPMLGVPLNLADLVVLTKNQLVMSYRIALAHGKSGRARDVLSEVTGVVGGGFLFRQAGRQLVGLIPVAGIPLKAAVAWAGTVAIGRAVAAWVSRGERLSKAAVARLYREAMVQAKGAAAFLSRSAGGSKGRRAP